LNLCEVGRGEGGRNWIREPKKYPELGKVESFVDFYFQFTKKYVAF